MTHRKLKARDFVGKTVARVDVRAVNIIRFFFTDGSAVAIEVDHFGHDLWGMVACDECTNDPVPKRAAPEAEAMTKTTPFWQSVRELAAMRDRIPKERREMSGGRDAVRRDVRTKSKDPSDEAQLCVDCASFGVAIQHHHED